MTCGSCGTEACLDPVCTEALADSLVPPPGTIRPRRAVQDRLDEPIRELLKDLLRRGMTALAVAQAAGVSHSLVCAWRRGLGLPVPRRLDRQRRVLVVQLVHDGHTAREAARLARVSPTVAVRWANSAGLKLRKGPRPGSAEAKRCGPRVTPERAGLRQQVLHLVTEEGLTAQEAARAAGVTDRTACRWLNEAGIRLRELRGDT